ncbi:MAG: Re/Si-specific NAD(P)(+) transhydrogenase subunit alpha [Devosia sp.]|nr:Re/Si-specific NAD(P)(+) transhydrogenase subunit alpha [Devosia sp.]
MKIAILRERADGETRVAATPETVTRFVALGTSVTVEAGAGGLARFPDADYKAAGAEIAATAAAAVKDADIVLTVRRPEAGPLAGMAKGALVVGGMDPYGHENDIAALAKAGATVIAMEFMPRITRAQVMDILSSQANLAGYQAVIDAAVNFDRVFPMMMTAAGTVRPAKAFVMGAGVAGLQAIATARRLGAVVTATDVRPAAKEQVESLGAKFIAVEDEEFKQAETAAGYAKPMSAEYQKKQAELTASHIAKQDIVITTALIPGRPAPKLVSKAMIESMAPGSVIVDLAAERGGNVELTVPGQVVTTPNDVTIIGYTNMPGRVATSASQLYARNLYAFIETLFDKKTKAFAINWDDELIKATLLTRDGAVVHPNLAAAVAAPAAPKAAAKAEAAAPAKPAAKAEAAAPAKPAAAKKTAASKAVAKPEPTAVVAVTPAEHKQVEVVKPAAARKPAAPKAAKSGTVPDKPVAAKPKAPPKPRATKPTPPKTGASE